MIHKQNKNLSVPERITKLLPYYALFAYFLILNSHSNVSWMFFKWGLLPITQTQCQRLLDACAMWPRMTGSEMSTDWALVSLYRWRCAFRLLLWFRIEEQGSVKQDTALASEAISDNGSISHVIFPPGSIVVTSLNMSSRENEGSTLALVNSELVFWPITEMVGGECCS